jgi:predicted N-formylglutamate amidohydrolase
MPPEGVDNASLLTADEPAAFEVLNPGSTKPLLFVCDHASSRFPIAVGDLGVDLAVQRCHLGSDIGAGGLTASLARRLGATAVMQQYSRLVIDCNRQLLDPGAFLEFGDGAVIAGNRNLDAAQKKLRADEIYWPYHRAIDAEIERLSGDKVKPSMLAIHSFSPVLNGVFRPWQIGVLWDKDARIPEPLITLLRESGLTVGDNEPYSGKALQDFTIDSHAEPAELPHVGIEIRQDLIDSEEGIEAIADIFEPVIDNIQSQIFATNISTRERTLRA